MQIRSDTIIASFIVALFSSFLTALAVLLVKILAQSVVRADIIFEYVLNIYILFFFAAFVFYRGSRTAAWLLYKHETSWGYSVTYRQTMPIFAISFLMSCAVFFALNAYFAQELSYLSLLEHSRYFLEKARRL